MVQAIESVAKHCVAWPKEHESFADQFIADIDQLIELNLAFRKAPSKFIGKPTELARSWPHDYFVFAKLPLSFIDVRQKDPPVQFITDRQLNIPNHLTPSRYANCRVFAKQVVDGYKTLHKFAAQRDKENTRKATLRDSKATPSVCPDLVREGWEIAKPAIRLRLKGKRYMAVWGGPGIVDLPEQGWYHWITVDCSEFPQNPTNLTGLISLYECKEQGRFKVAHDPTGVLPRKASGTKLFGSSFDCLPPFGILVNKASVAVKKWVKGEKIDHRDAEGWADAYRKREPQVERYIQEFESNHPFYLQDCEAMLGGWTIAYPGGDSNHLYSVMNKPLLISTFRDSEPWLEVVGSGKRFSVEDHIT